MTDTARLKKLLAHLEWDGWGYWFPEKPIKVLEHKQEYTPPPTMKEFREFIDDMENR